MLLDVLLPRGCAGCDAPDEVLCADCQALFNGCYERDFPASSLGTAYAAACYAGPVRRAILAWKDHDDVELDKPFIEDIAALTQRCGISTESEVLVIPAPSSKHSMRQRGRNHVLPLAKAVAEVLDGEVCCALESRASRKSVQLGRGSQRSNRAQRADSSIALVDHADVDGCTVVLVDDIMTTGSTLRQCASVLREEGATVLTALTLASADQSLTM